MSRHWPKQPQEIRNIKFFMDAPQDESVCQTGDDILCICYALKEGGVYSLVLRRSSLDDNSYERIGCSSTSIDWYLDAREKILTII